MIKQNITERKFANNLREAKRVFLARTGYPYGRHRKLTGIDIWKLKNPTKTRRYFIGTELEFLNLQQ